MSATQQTLATVELFNEAFNRHEVEAVMRLMTDDIVFENTSDGRFEGQEAVRALLTRAFALMSTGWFDTEEMFAARDHCVVLWRYTFNREAPERNDMRGVDVFRVRDGLVAEKLSYVKSEEFVRQLGLQSRARDRAAGGPYLFGYRYVWGYVHARMRRQAISPIVWLSSAPAETKATT